MIKKLRDALRHRRNVKAHLWQSGANYIQQGSALVMSMVLARLLTPEHFGEFALANAYVQLGFMPSYFEVDHILVSKGKREGDYSGVMTVAYCLSVLRLVVLAGLAIYLNGARHPLTAILCLLCGMPEIFSPILNAIKSDLEGDGNFRQNMEGMVWSQGAGFVAAVVGALCGLGVFALCFSPWLALLSRMMVYRRYATCRMFPRPDWSGWKPLRTYGPGLWLIQLAQTGTARIDKWFVGTHIGAGALGCYSRAFNWSPLSHMALSSLMTNASVAALSQTNSIEEQKRYLKKISALTLSCGVVNFLFWFFGADYCVVRMFGSQWSSAVPLFKAFAGLSFCYAFADLPASVLLAHRKYVPLGAIRLTGLAGLCLALWGFRPQSGIAAAVFVQMCWMLIGLANWAWVVIVFSRCAVGEPMRSYE